MKSIKPLPRIESLFNFAAVNDTEEEEQCILDKQHRFPRLPEVVVAIIIDFYEQFEIARLKDFYYKRFTTEHSRSLSKSASNLNLFNRELKTLQWTHQMSAANFSLLQWIKDSKRCKRNYVSKYENLKQIFL